MHDDETNRMNQRSVHHEVKCPYTVLVSVKVCMYMYI